MPLQFGRCGVVADNDAFGVHLQSRDRPHLGNAAFYALLQGFGFVVPVNDDKDIPGRHDSTDTYGESRFGNKMGIASEETGVGDNCVLGQCFYAGA